MKRLGSTGLAVRALGLAAVLASPFPVRALVVKAFALTLDQPLSAQTVKATGSRGQINCVWYVDLMVRETGTDTPDPDNATLTPIRPGAAAPPCTPTPGRGAIKIKTEGFSLVGRKGAFLIWDATDPNGAEPFKVMNTAGKLLFTDATTPDAGPRRAATLQGGVLYLAYTRGYNADCSLMQNARRCWAKLVAAKVVPASAQPLTAAPASCRAAYKGVGADDPSVIVFTTEVAIDAAGKSAVLSRGPVSCLPMP